MENKQKFNLSLNILLYKVYKCTKKICKKDFKCFYYHSDKDKRRDIFKTDYYYKLCVNRGKCKYESNCKYSHNIYESLYHPTYYKTIFCIEYLEKKICNYKKYCFKAHKKEEIRIELIHHYKKDYNFFIFKYKTVFCPIKYVKHNKDKCVYSHNYQDYRRKPNNNYINEICKFWNSKIIPDIYSSVCSFNCKYFHGWKEAEYHYINYKTKICQYSYVDCKYKNNCSKIHWEYDKYYKDILKQINKNLMWIVENRYYLK